MYKMVMKLQDINLLHFCPLLSFAVGWVRHIQVHHKHFALSNAKILASDVTMQIPSSVDMAKR